MPINFKKNIRLLGMLRFKTIILLLGIVVCCKAQQSKIDSIRTLIADSRTDTSRIILYENLAGEYRNAKKIESSILCYQKALEINRKISFSPLMQLWNLATIDYLFYLIGNYSKSLEYGAEALKLSEQLGDTLQMANAIMNFGLNYSAMGHYRQALDELFKVKRIFEEKGSVQHGYESPLAPIQLIGDVYFQMNKLDSALIFTQRALQLSYSLLKTDPVGFQYHEAYSFRLFGNIYLAKGDDRVAIKYYQKFLDDYYKYDLNNREVGFVYYEIARICEKRSEIDSSIVYAKKAFEAAQAYEDQESIYKSANYLYKLYKPIDEHQALNYLTFASEAKDSLISSEKIKQAGILGYNAQMREKEKKEADAKATARTRLILIVAGIIISIIGFLIWKRIRQLRLRYKAILDQKEGEKLKVKYEKQLLELEAKALRAQMNPHFIYNCMNSIKALIQNDDKLRSIEYLITFSKLIRTIFQNSDKRQISLYDEIETCKLYTHLEAMRLNGKLKYHFDVDPNLDLKSVLVPALIIQPFIENAIWHGIVPNDGGAIAISVIGNEEAIICEVDDDGIGREMSKLNKPVTPVIHESKGVHLSQQRLNLEKMRNDTNGSIEIIDKYQTSLATGTKVTLTFTLG